MFVLGPYKDTDTVTRIVNATYDFNNGIYTVDCSTVKNLPDLIFTVNGQDLDVPANEYVIDLELENNTCALGVENFDVAILTGFSETPPSDHGN